MKATARHLKDPACALSLSFGAGLFRWAPGTAGALVAFPIFIALHELPLLASTALLAAFFIAGCFAATRACEQLGEEDHQAVVWDETVGRLMVLLAVPPGLDWWLAAFLAFRCLDIVKPWPIRLADIHTKGGLAVMLDDAGAALYAISLLLAVDFLLTWL